MEFCGPGHLSNQVSARSDKLPSTKSQAGGDLVKSRLSYAVDADHAYITSMGIGLVLAMQRRFGSRLLT